MLPDFTSRALISELMDNPNCDETRLLRTIRQFASINRLVARYRTILARWVLDDMQQFPEKEYHLVDMGAGGCDIDAWLLKSARKRGLNLRITACDLDPRIIAYARAEYGHLPGLEIRELDLLEGGFDEPVDYVFANHFLHHLTSEQIIRLFRLWFPLVRRRMVFSDLLRSRAAYLGFSVFSLFYTNSFSRTDGLTSIQRGFLAAEFEALAKTALGTGFTTHRFLPGRLVLCIDGKAVDTA
jgi:SAM-dependent methyltransferase